jgi:Spy/CpxP family protein refolding chaperone
MKKITGWMVLSGAAVVGVVGLAVGTAAAQQAGNEVAAATDDDDCPGAGRMGRIGRELGLTDEQIAKAQELREAFRTETRDLHEQVRAVMQTIPDLIRKPDLTKDELMAVHDQASEIRDQIGEKRIEKVFEFLQTLTAAVTVVAAVAAATVVRTPRVMMVPRASPVPAPSAKVAGATAVPIVPLPIPPPPRCSSRRPLPTSCST